MPLQKVLIPEQGKGDIWKKWVISTILFLGKAGKMRIFVLLQLKENPESSSEHVEFVL